MIEKLMKARTEINKAISLMDFRDVQNLSVDEVFKLNDYIYSAIEILKEVRK